MSKPKQLGRLTLFVNDKRGRTGAPDYNGKFVTEKGTYVVDLWKEETSHENGHMLKGTISEMWKKED